MSNQTKNPDPNSEADAPVIRQILYVFAGFGLFTAALAIILRVVVA